MSLTDERINLLGLQHLGWEGLGTQNRTAFARAIEAEVMKSCVCGDSSAQGVFHRNDGPCYIAIEAEGGKSEPQEAIGLFAQDNDGRWVQTFHPDGCQLYTTPQPCPKCAELGTTVVQQAEHISQLEAVVIQAGVEASELEARLLNREGMTCEDCNDTGWLENREEGRYPCTCMTEAEPYQLLRAECDALKAECAKEYQRGKDETLEQIRHFKQVRDERDALAVTAQKMRDVITEAVDEIESLACRDNTCDPHPDLSDYVAFLANLPDTAEIIKRHDAEVLRKAAELPYCEAWEGPYKSASAHITKRLLDMAAELEKS